MEFDQLVTQLLSVVSKQYIHTYIHTYYVHTLIRHIFGT